MLSRTATTVKTAKKVMKATPPLNSTPFSDILRAQKCDRRMPRKGSPLSLKLIPPEVKSGNLNPLYAYLDALLSFLVHLFLKDRRQETQIEVVVEITQGLPSSEAYCAVFSVVHCIGLFSLISLLCLLSRRIL